MKNQINWEEYNSAFDLEKSENEMLNEYADDLHKMTMKENLKKFYLSADNKKLVKENEDFEKTNQDFFNYEKELEIGKTN